MSSLNASNNLTTKPMQPPAQALSPLVRQIAYSFISLLSFFGNLLVFALMYKKRRTHLKKNGYFLITILALCDTITGILIFMCPKHVFFKPVFEPSSGVALTLFCEIAFSRTVIFTLGAVSIYICLLITVDRWVAVVKPMKYRQIITKPKLLLALAFCTTLVFTVTWLGKTKVIIVSENPPGKKCVSRGGPTFIPPGSAKAMDLAAVVIRTLAPSILIAALYAHMLYKYKHSSSVTQNHGNAARKKLTTVAAMTSLAIVICWFPNQGSYFLYKLGIVSSMQTTFAQLSGVLAMMNSAINPFIYGFASSEFRRGYWEVMLSCCSCFPVLKKSCCNSAIGVAGEESGGKTVEESVVVTENGTQDSPV